MSQESRVRKSLLNARVNLIFYFLTLALSFFSRKIFLDTLGADFVGLTGTLQNLLGFLNLAELGIGSAIGYVLYKPLFDHDETKINEIISVFGYLYRWIGKIILIAGCILAFFLPLIFPNTEFDLGLIFFAYFSFLASSLIGYFANYKQTLLGADQKNYVVTTYFQTATIIKTIIQMALAYYTGNYYLWVIVELSFGIIYSFILNWKINQVYPWLKSEVSQGRILFKKYPEVMKYTKQLFVHQIANFVQFQLSPFFVYAFTSLQIVTYYGNYTLVIDKLSLLMNSFLNSTSAGIGNLIAEGNRKKIIEVFWELTSIRFWFAGLIVIPIFYLMDSFIIIWLGEQYVLSRITLYLILFNIFIRLTQGTIGQFLYGYGLFRDVWSSIIQTIIFIIVAIIGGYYRSLNGIIFANCFSLIVILCGWKPYYLYKKGFDASLLQYWIKWLKCCFPLMIAFWGIRSVRIGLSVNNPKSILDWSLDGFMIVITYSLLSTVAMTLIFKEFRFFLFRILKIKK